mgnify:CR=1 FL=1|jgi:hypothetical protein
MGRSGGCCLPANCTAPPCPSGSCCYTEGDINTFDTFEDAKKHVICEEVTENCCLAKPFSVFNIDQKCGEQKISCDNTMIPEVFSTDKAFALLTNYGGVIAWGDPLTGGDQSSLQSSLRSNVVDIFSNPVAFVALKEDHSAVCWGDSSRGGFANVDLTNIKSVTGSHGAFAAIKRDGTVVAWGEAEYGGVIPSSISSLLVNIVEIVSTDNHFAARDEDGTVFIWGNGEKAYDKRDVNKSGSVTTLDSLQVLNHLERNDPYSSPYDVNRNGSVTSLDVLQITNYLALESPTYDSGFTDVKKIYSNRYAFAFLTNNGKVFVWGDEDKGGDTGSRQSLLVNVDEIYSADDSFLAHLSDKKIIVWGNIDYVDPEFYTETGNRKRVNEIIAGKHSYGVVYFEDVDGFPIDEGYKFNVIGSVKPNRANFVGKQVWITGSSPSPPTVGSLPLVFHPTRLYTPWEGRLEKNTNNMLTASDNAYYIYNSLNGDFYTVGHTFAQEDDINGSKKGGLADGSSFLKEYDALNIPTSEGGAYISNIYDNYKYVGRASKDLGLSGSNSIQYTRTNNVFAFTDRASAFLMDKLGAWYRRSLELPSQDEPPYILSVGDLNYGGYGTTFRRDRKDLSTSNQQLSPIGDDGDFYAIYSNRHAFCAIKARRDGFSEPDPTSFQVVCWGNPDFGGNAPSSFDFTFFGVNFSDKIFAHEGCHDNFCNQDF